MNDYLERLTAVLTDRYVIECKLGNGRMATVYLAQHIKHDRRVAIKVLLPVDEAVRIATEVAGALGYAGAR